MSADVTEFGFGLEAEFILCDSASYEPRSLNSLDAQSLQSMLLNVDVKDIPLNGLAVKPLHEVLSPYMVEGYYLTDEKMNKRILLPKGIEIMTPVAKSITRAVADLSVLFDRLNNEMKENGMACSILSHHPTAPDFYAAPNYDRHDYWQWALTAMTTYGPDVNISVPAELSKDIDVTDLNRKINYYMPAACALSFSSPLKEGGLWKKRHQIGKSIRTHRRSIWAPLFYVHTTPHLRYEFKGFEMSNDLHDYEAYFLMSLAVLLDDTLTGRASDQTRIYDLGELAVDGLRNDAMQHRAQVVLQSASRMAGKLGFSDRSLAAFWNRLDSHRLPADEIIELYLERSNINDVLRDRSYFKNATALLKSAPGSKPADAQIEDTRIATPAQVNFAPRQLLSSI
jgi:hypothetical protein